MNIDDIDNIESVRNANIIHVWETEALARSEGNKLLAPITTVEERGRAAHEGFMGSINTLKELGAAQ